MHKLIDFSLKNKVIVLILTAVLVGTGITSMLRLPIDAVPDVTPNQVLVLTTAPGLGPAEVERFITFPVETAMSGLPGIEQPHCGCYCMKSSAPHSAVRERRLCRWTKNTVSE